MMSSFAPSSSLKVPDPLQRNSHHRSTVSDEPSSGSTSGTKRKHRGDDVSKERSPPCGTGSSGGGGGGGRGGKRFRRVSGSTHQHHNGSDHHDRGKNQQQYQRSQSFSRDPLGLDPNPPPVTIGKTVNGGHNKNISHNHSRYRRSPYKQVKDPVIMPPKQVMCPDPLQLEVQIKKYNASHAKDANGLSKTERQAERFRYGNYNRYYGYREVATDPRYPLMRREWVEGRECLDIGCNTGQFTLALTKEFAPRFMVGIDIDKKLIRVAKRNVRHYLTEDICRREGFPKSLPILYGPLAAPVAILDSGTVNGPREFPCNIAFLECDYVPHDDVQCRLETEEFDTIFALSITKWIHLNCGDDGLKRFFQRVFRHLRPGGRLILEPQEWSSYSNGKNKGKLTADMKSIYQTIKLVPDQFQEYLLSKEIGFEECEKIELSSKTSVSAGFQRCLFVFKKPSPTTVPSGTS